MHTVFISVHLLIKIIQLSPFGFQPSSSAFNNALLVGFVITSQHGVESPFCFVEYAVRVCIIIDAELKRFPIVHVTQLLNLQHLAVLFVGFGR